MTRKEKAKELVDKFQKQIFFDVTNERLDIEEAKGCALIAVDEIYKTNLIFGRYEYEENPEFFYSYWEEVKQEIEKL